MARYHYYVDVYNEYLGKHRRVSGPTRREAEFRADLVRQQWAVQESRARDRQAIADGKAQALSLTEEGRMVIEEHRSILSATLSVDDRVAWDELVADRPFDEPAPVLEEIRTRLRVPRRKAFLESLRIGLRAVREAAESDAQSLFEDEMEGWRKRRERHEHQVTAEVAEVIALREAYELGEPQAVAKYVSLVLSRSHYPDTFPQTSEVEYRDEQDLAVVNFHLPRLDEIPSVSQWRFDPEREELVAVDLSERQRADLYDEIAYQAVLRTIHEVFEGDYKNTVHEIVVNAFTVSTSPATGLDERICVASCIASREAFERYDLARVKPRECFRALNGLVARRPSSMVAVQPIRQLVQVSESVGIDLGDRGDIPDDLLVMDPFAFEQLVGALFGRLYGEQNATVEVTQASRDGGVDVVVNDHDPIKGGKVIVQVKRYNGVVGVGYVRELYGTMINEGAAKGILVATGHYGVDAHAFAEGKPITLIDGDRLLEMLGGNGWNYRIGEFAPAVPADERAR